MEISIRFPEFILYALLLAIPIILIIRSAKRKKNQVQKAPPEPGGSWPLIGHLHLLEANTLLHRTLSAMADDCGPVFCFHLGSHKVLVVSSYEAAKECFTINDKTFSSRPNFIASKLMAYDKAMLGLAPYGPYWRDLRKLAKMQLLSNHRLELLKHVRDSETRVLMKELCSLCVKNGGSAVVEMKEVFGDMAMNIIVRELAGKRYFGANLSNDGESRRCQKALGEFFYFMGLFMFSDTIPLLGWVDYVRGFTGKMKKTGKELDLVFGRWVQEHRKQRINGDVSEKDKDFIHVMLTAMEDDDNPTCDVDTVIKSTCLSLILGGNDTTVITLTWALALLLNNKNILKKAQNELDTVVGINRQVEESDIENLPYLQAIVKETLRLKPPLPLSAPRVAMEDCTVAGYHVSAGTRLLLNIWKLHRDPSNWKDPLGFRPERFLEENEILDVKGNDYEFLPFGAGRRMCPGVTSALQVLHLTLSRLLHVFEIGTVSDKPVDMTEAPGMTLPKSSPLEVVLTPRLPLDVYQYMDD